MRRNIAKFLILFICTAFTMPLQAGKGPSFNCKKASTVQEKMICSSEELSKLDREMSHVYRRLKELKPYHAKKQQKFWLEMRKGEDTASLLIQYYKKRIFFMRLSLKHPRDLMNKDVRNLSWQKVKGKTFAIDFRCEEVIEQMFPTSGQPAAKGKIYNNSMCKFYEYLYQGDENPKHDYLKDLKIESLPLAKLPFLACDFQEKYLIEQKQEPSGYITYVYNEFKSTHWVKQCKKFMSQKKEFSLFNPQVKRNGINTWDQIQQPIENMVVSPKCRLQNAVFFGRVYLNNNKIVCIPWQPKEYYGKDRNQGFKINQYAFRDVNHDGIMDIILDIWKLGEDPDEYVTGDTTIVLTKLSPLQKGFTRLFFNDYQSPIEFDFDSISKTDQ